jgi:flagellar motor protein MotB
MRNLYIVLSILCYTLSGIITYKALNLPEKNPLNLEALSKVKSHKSLLVVKEFLTEPAIEQAPLNSPAEKLQNTTSQPEQKLENKSAVLQINFQTLLDTVKEFLQKLINKDNVSQTDTQTSEEKSSQLERKLTDKIVDSQMNIQTLETTVKQLEQKLSEKNASSQTDTQTAENKTAQLERKLTNKIADSQNNIQTSKNIIAQQEHTPAPLENISQSKLNISEPENTEESMVLLLGDVGFSSGQIVINDNMTKFIEQSAQHILTFLPNCRLVVEGHTDSIPLLETWPKLYKDNMEISFSRAKAVARAFEKEGLSSKRISVIGYGDTRPIASNGIVEGRAKNRRVVVKLIPNEKEI